MGKRKERSKPDTGAASTSHPLSSQDDDEEEEDDETVLNPNEDGANKDAAFVQQASITGNHDTPNHNKQGDNKSVVSSVRKSKREKKQIVAAAAAESTMDSAKIQNTKETDPKQQAAKRAPTESNVQSSFSPGPEHSKPAIASSSHSNSSKALPLTKNSCQKPEPTSGRGSRKPLPSKKRLLEPNGEPAQSEQKRGKKKNDSTDDAEKEFDTSWICGECKEAECMMKSDADELLICEGVCRRLFHYPCAGLSRPPPKEEEYICPDCTSGRHACAQCQEYGVDDMDVFLCSCKDGCGLFFHESCLELLNVEVKLVPEKHPSTNTTTTTTAPITTTEGMEHETKIRREFVCPAHNCWTCTQTDMAAKQEASNNNEASVPPKKDRGGNKKKRRGGKKAVIHHAFQQKKIPLLIVSLQIYRPCT